MLIMRHRGIDTYVLVGLRVDLKVVLALEVLDEPGVLLVNELLGHGGMGLAVRLARAEAKQQQQPARTLGCAFSLRARYLELSRWRASIIDGRRVEGCLDRAAAAADLVIGGQASAGQESDQPFQPTAPQHPPISPPPNKSTSLCQYTRERPRSRQEQRSAACHRQQRSTFSQAATFKPRCLQQPSARRLHDEQRREGASRAPPMPRNEGTRSNIA